MKTICLLCIQCLPIIYLYFSFKVDGHIGISVLRQKRLLVFQYFGRRIYQYFSIKVEVISVFQC